jgi:hypothetical protein
LTEIELLSDNQFLLNALREINLLSRNLQKSASLEEAHDLGLRLEVRANYVLRRFVISAAELQTLNSRQSLFRREFGRNSLLATPMSQVGDRMKS